MYYYLFILGIRFFSNAFFATFPDLLIAEAKMAISIIMQLIASLIYLTHILV